MGGHSSKGCSFGEIIIPTAHMPQMSWRYEAYCFIYLDFPEPMNQVLRPLAIQFAVRMEDDTPLTIIGRIWISETRFRVSCTEEPPYLENLFIDYTKDVEMFKTLREYEYPSWLNQIVSPEGMALIGSPPPEDFLEIK